MQASGVIHAAPPEVAHVSVVRSGQFSAMTGPRHWVKALIEEQLCAQPQADSDSVKTVDTVEDLQAADGSAIHFVGQALAWEPAKGSTIGLAFEAPWFTERDVELLVWTSIDVQLSITCLSAGGVPVNVALTAGRALEWTAKVLPELPHKGETVRVLVRIAGKADADARIFFGKGDIEAPRATRMRARLVWGPALRLYLITWLNLAMLLFIGATGFGLGRAGALGPVLLVVPTVLEKLGAQSAAKLSPGAASQWMRTRLPKLVRPWKWAVVPIGAVVGFMIAAFVLRALFESTLQEHLERTAVTTEEHVAFFCNYPERVETRVLLAKHLEIRAAEKSLVNAYDSATSKLDVGRFLHECLAAWRLLPWVMEEPERQAVNARILYASLHWNTSKSAEFGPRLERIREVLQMNSPMARHSTASTAAGAAAQPAEGLLELTLAKYELKAVKNSNEQIHCRAPDSPKCQSGRKECEAVQKRLESLINRPWQPYELASVAYLEANDAVASSHLSFGCTFGAPADTDAAVRHYWNLIGAMPTASTLEQALTQINFRKFIDSRIDQEPAHPTSKAWSAECARYYKESCDAIARVFIKPEKQRFFETNAAERDDSWGKPSLTYLDSAALRTRLLDEKERGWAWPL